MRQEGYNYRLGARAAAGGGKHDPFQPDTSGSATFSGTAGLSLAVALVTLAALEIVLRVADFRMLREGNTERSLSYRYDAELGWAPIPNSSSVVTTARTIHVQHNQPWLRDVESAATPGRPSCFSGIRSSGAWMPKPMSVSLISANADS